MVQIYELFEQSNAFPSLAALNSRSRLTEILSLGSVYPDGKIAVHQFLKPSVGLQAAHCPVEHFAHLIVRLAHEHCYAVSKEPRFEEWPAAQHTATLGQCAVGPENQTYTIVEQGIRLSCLQCLARQFRRLVRFNADIAKETVQIGLVSAAANNGNCSTIEPRRRHRECGRITANGKPRRRKEIPLCEPDAPRKFRCDPMGSDNSICGLLLQRRNEICPRQHFDIAGNRQIQANGPGEVDIEPRQDPVFIGRVEGWKVVGRDKPDQHPLRRFKLTGSIRVGALPSGCQRPDKNGESHKDDIREVGQTGTPGPHQVVSYVFRPELRRWQDNQDCPKVRLSWDESWLILRRQNNRQVVTLPSEFTVFHSARQGRDVTPNLPPDPVANLDLDGYGFLLNRYIDFDTLNRARLIGLGWETPPHGVMLTLGWLSVEDYTNSLAEALNVGSRYQQATTINAVTIDATSGYPNEVARAIGIARLLEMEVALYSPYQTEFIKPYHIRLFDGLNAIDTLRSRLPEFSADQPSAEWLHTAGFMLIGFFTGIAVVDTWLVLLSIGFVAFLPFAAVVLQRMLAFCAFLSMPKLRRPRPSPRSMAYELPVYTILIPLLDEAEIIPDLVDALISLDYPAIKLDVILILEDTDDQTHTAVCAAGLPGFIRVVSVPDLQPKTKPKALNYGIQFARGEYVVVYDAEDIPEPDQLRLALQAFDSEPGVDCLQARLNVYNGSTNWLARQFALEYTALFDGLLPALKRLGDPYSAWRHIQSLSHRRAATQRRLGPVQCH